MQKNNLLHAISEVDKMLVFITKSNKWLTLGDKLSDLLQSTTDEGQEKAIKIALKQIEDKGEDLTPDDIINTTEELQDRLRDNITPSLRSIVIKYQVLAYKYSYKDIGINFEFNKANTKVINWLETDQMYWISNHYDSDLRDKLLNKAQEIVKQGLSWDQAGVAYHNMLSETYKGDKSYWNGLANHIITRSREFARVDGYLEAGIKEVKIQAILDHRTSLICRELHGKIIKVKTLAKQREKLLNAENPEAVKKLAPFWSDKMVLTEIAGSTELPDTIGLPPYHFNCRTITVPVIEE